MARRKDHSREELTEIAIEAAIMLVREAGPPGLTARNVAKKIGYTPGTLYNVFSNLEELAARVNQRSLEALSAEFAALAAKKDSFQQLKGICRVYIDFYNKEPELWELLFAYPIIDKPEWYLASITKTFEGIAKALEAHGKKSEDARREAKVLWATLHGLCSLHHAGKLDVGKPDSLESLSRQFLSRYFG